jgi:hypothetical protein
LREKVTAAALQLAEKNVWARGVVRDGDAPPVLELGEHILDIVTLAIQRLVVANRRFPVLGRRNAGLVSVSDRAYQNHWLGAFVLSLNPLAVLITMKAGLVTKWFALSR